MNWLVRTGCAAFAVASAGAFVALPAAAAEGTTVGASIDATSDAEGRTDGGLATATATAGANFASAEADLFRLHVIGSDVGHFSTGAPGSTAFSEFFFEVQGAVGPVELTFNFTTNGAFYYDPNVNFTRNGSFSIFLSSATGQSPLVIGGFNDVQCIGCGGRISGGSITEVEDYYGPGTVTTTPWLGTNPGSYALTSTFQGGLTSGGRLQLLAAGGAGTASYDFELALGPITTPGSAEGLSIFLPASGQRLAIIGGGGAVPEPSAWALMIGGFGGAGAMLRRRRQAAFA